MTFEFNIRKREFKFLKHIVRKFALEGLTIIDTETEGAKCNRIRNL